MINVYKIAIVTMIGVTMMGCSSTRLPGDPRMRVDNKRIEVTAETVNAAVDVIRPYALMSALAYRTYSNPEMEPTNCARPLCDFDQWLHAHSWSFQGHKKFRCATQAKQYLEFDLWLNTNLPSTQVVVAFRGTHANPDWLSNLRMLMPLRRWADQYSRIHYNDVVEPIVALCNKAGPGATLVTTGHSLGGGLAQHLLYYSQLWPTNQALRSYVFNSSPMTGWHQFGDERESEKAKTLFRQNQEDHAPTWSFPEVMAEKYGYGTMRVNERGEFLAWARGVSRLFCKEESFMSVLNAEFSKNGMISKHSMKDLANNLLYYQAKVPTCSTLCADESTCTCCARVAGAPEGDGCVNGKE